MSKLRQRDILVLLTCRVTRLFPKQDPTKIRPTLKLERWLSTSEYLLLLQRTWILFPTSLGQLTTFSKPSARGSKILRELVSSSGLGVH